MPGEEVVCLERRWCAWGGGGVPGEEGCAWGGGGVPGEEVVCLGRRWSAWGGGGVPGEEEGAVFQGTQCIVYVMSLQAMHLHVAIPVDHALACSCIYVLPASLTG